ncbi:hypothetical protein [Undibacterium pigrum]|uniref:Uncharacterized protein n=1 Tax=Undibacterium pigrum TaxID=401470 RepID=A0A318JCG8_9BURK|nr:hypothetical protein [Undibacterium pigrum]PXX41528.1 hypothetical protein DFR42_107179 [Undibacterium pigrum]
MNKNRMNKSADKEQLEDTAGFQFFETLLFIITIALFFFVGEKASIRFSGFVMLFFACRTLLIRRLPYGIEGQEPMGYLTGIPAIISGLIGLLLAALMIFRPAQVLDFFR